MSRMRTVDAVSARNYLRAVVAVIDLFIFCRKGINVESVGVEKFGKFERAVHEKRFGTAHFGSNFEQPLDNFKRCETSYRVTKSSHNIFLQPLSASARRTIVRLRFYSNGCSNTPRGCKRREKPKFVGVNQEKGLLLF